MSHAAASTPIPSSTPIRAMLAVAIIACVVIRALSEWAMLSQFPADAQMPIWWGSLVIKALFWLVTGLGIVWLTTIRRPRGLIAFAFLVIWAVAIQWASVNYWQGRQALIQAVDPRTSPERLTKLANFQGIKAGYELDNRLAANPNTPASVLRELHQRKDQVGTQVKLAANPNTPEDILLELSRHEDVDVRRQLAKNPAIGEAVIERLEQDVDSQVRGRLANNPAASEMSILR
jgi:hypothetical protein